MTTPHSILSPVAAVIIGRNEGERLRLCLQSVLAQCVNVVYVDSGSTDGSVALAQSLGARVVQLDTSIPFTAARARNAGLDLLLQPTDQHPTTPLYVQFIDGDCELNLGFIAAASAELDSNPTLAAVAGRLRERYPENSLYNKLCDIEWNTPIGETTWCGGVSLMRISALQQVNAFNPALIAGEEPELCFRLREKGWKIRRIDFEMALHDAAITRFGQWWNRSRRAGYSYGLGHHLHGKSPEKYCRREVRRIWIWGVALPAIALLAIPFTNGLSIFLIPLGLVILFLRLLGWVSTLGLHAHDARNLAFFTALAKLPEAHGLLTYHYRKLRKRQPAIIEYKKAIPAPQPAV